jgi:kynureninase
MMSTQPHPSTLPLTRADFVARDTADPLASLREQFRLPAGLIYLDGNSLGVMPAATPARLAQVVEHEWGRDLIASWNTAGWVDLPSRIGDKIAGLIGAAAGEVAVADSTSINLYKVLSAALTLQAQKAPQRRVILTEADNFPTDLYIAQSLAERFNARIEYIAADAITSDAITSRLADDVAVLMLTHVNYRSGRQHDMAALSRAAHDAGVITVWDLAHSAGAVPLDLHNDGADFAIGCGYKYLNGGPGAPAFVWVHPQHIDQATQPLCGWFGHAQPFVFERDYAPARGITRYQCGTPPILSLAALEMGVDTLLAAQAYGGMSALRRKSTLLTDAFIELIDQRCAAHALTLITPRQAAQRGSQVALRHPEGAYAIVQALIARGVVGDFRAPDILRFGFTPLYTRHIDVWDAVEQLVQVLDSGQWTQPHFAQRAAVT